MEPVKRKRGRPRKSEKVIQDDLNEDLSLESTDTKPAVKKPFIGGKK